MARKVLVLSVLALVACADRDGDGLSDGREERLGSDPALADTDGDGLDDGDEVQSGLDPVAWDTDGDGYSDFQEVDFGSDPLDATSGVYAGGWPYNPFKDDLSDPGFAGRPQIGEPLPRFVAIDQYGEQVDFYDYAGHGKPVMLDISALWCPPCRQMAGWLAGEGANGYGAYGVVKDAVDNGDLLWVTVMGEDNQGKYPDQQDLLWWEERYPNPEIALLADAPEVDLVGYMDIGFWPSLYLLDEELRLIKGPSPDSFVPALNEARSMLQE